MCSRCVWESKTKASKFQSESLAIFSNVMKITTTQNWLLLCFWFLIEEGGAAFQSCDEVNKGLNIYDLIGGGVCRQHVEPSGICKFNPRLDNELGWWSKVWLFIFNEQLRYLTYRSRVRQQNERKVQKVRSWTVDSLLFYEYTVISCDHLFYRNSLRGSVCWGYQLNDLILLLLQWL